jgi:hypothetical protein
MVRESAGANKWAAVVGLVLISVELFDAAVWVGVCGMTYEKVGACGVWVGVWVGVCVCVGGCVWVCGCVWCVLSLLSHTTPHQASRDTSEPPPSPRSSNRPANAPQHLSTRAPHTSSLNLPPHSSSNHSSTKKTPQASQHHVMTILQVRLSGRVVRTAKPSRHFIPLLLYGLPPSFYQYNSVLTSNNNNNNSIIQTHQHTYRSAPRAVWCFSQPWVAPPTPLRTSPLTLSSTNYPVTQSSSHTKTPQAIQQYVSTHQQVRPSGRVVRHLLL